MNLDLDNKVFVVSGSSRGIGFEIAKALAKENAHVLLTGRNMQELESAKVTLSEFGTGEVVYVHGDLNHSDVMSKIVDKIKNTWGYISGLVANAGATKPTSEWNINKEDWQWFMEANFGVARNFITPFIPDLIESKGSIVLIGSIAGIEEIGAPLPYSASKAALSMYAKGLARKLAADGVRVNVVNPGNVLFEGGNWAWRMNNDAEATKAFIAQNVPMNDFAKPSDISAITLFLLSHNARFITGSSIAVDGGQTSRYI
jgi:3-oxoacyl-[acyl-carrier protein] reductase